MDSVLLLSERYSENRKRSTTRWAEGDF